MPISLRVPPDVVDRVARLAEERETSPHAFMLEAIREKVEAEELRAGFIAEAEARAAKLDKTGKAIPADEVFAYLEARVSGRKARRPKARKIP